MLGTVAALVGNRRVEPRELPVPELADDEILLGIGLTGVCGSDLHRFQDIQKTLDLDVPVVMGHEISGRVLRLGRRANEVMKADGELREGDRVVVYSQRPCGQCYWCREHGHTARCDGPRPTGYGYRYGSVDAPPYFTGGFGDYLVLNVGRQITSKDIVLYAVAAQPAQAIGKALRTIAATADRYDYRALVGRVLPIAETQAAFELMEHPTDKPIKVAVRGAGY